ncbi:hypothetical protein ACFQJ5_08770 [Halomicroarcula sp. GCM10025324]|uniref:hypothetical protein n=1 Tax=Haloarcula TaxID=2237 RepID=UPI0023E88BDA|nr:hypothetical protein [Halomicroarcula sp. ZS-22-S1]
MAYDHETETSARRITPVNGSATVAPETEVLFEIAVPEYVDGGVETRWTVDGRDVTDVGPLHDEYLHNGMDFLQQTFDSAGAYDVTALLLDESGEETDSVTWTVTVEDGGSRPPVLDRPTAAQEVTYSDESTAIDLTIATSDPDGDLHRTVWFLRGGDAYLGSTSVEGEEDTATVSVDTFCDYCRVFVLLVDENGAVRSTAPYYFHRVEDASVEETGIRQTMTIESDDGDRVFYEFEVGGTLSYGRPGEEDDPAHPEFIEGARARGAVDGDSEDTFTFTGELTDFRTEGPAVVSVGDDRLDLSVFGDDRLDLSVFDADLVPRPSDDEAAIHDLVVESTGEDQAFYEFSVSGDLDYGDDRDAPFPRDRDGATVTGSVGSGERDQYRYTGDVTACSVVGPATVRVDGEPADFATTSASADEDDADVQIQIVESDVSVALGVDLRLQGLVRNEGEAAGTRQVRTTLTSDAASLFRRDLRVDLEPDELSFVDFETFDTAGLPPGEYTFTVTTGDDTDSTTITVESD